MLKQEFEKAKTDVALGKPLNHVRGRMLLDEIERQREVIIEIANRASNLVDKDAADWLPGIYKIACEAVGEDPWRLLRSAGYDPVAFTVGDELRS